MLRESRHKELRHSELFVTPRKIKQPPAQKERTRYKKFLANFHFQKKFSRANLRNDLKRFLCGRSAVNCPVFSLKKVTLRIIGNAHVILRIRSVRVQNARIRLLHCEPRLRREHSSNEEETRIVEEVDRGSRKTDVANKRFGTVAS